MHTFANSTALTVSCVLLIAACGGGSGSKTSNEGGSEGDIGGNAGESSGGASTQGGEAQGGTAGKSASRTKTGGAGGTSTDGTAGSGGTTTTDTRPCTLANDNCPKGHYCSAPGVCTVGCKANTDCTSNACLPSHNCQSCISDAECTNGMLCGSGVCSVSCTEPVGQGGGTSTSTCGTDLTCCGTRCVETNSDSKNCLGCGISCASGEFCGTTGCKPVKFENVCKANQVTGILVENAEDAVDDAQTTLLVSAVSTTCSPAPTSQFKGQLTGGVLNPTTGQPVSRGSLLAVAGGWFFQHLVKYMNDQAYLPVYDDWDWTAFTVTMRLRSNNSAIRALNMSTMSAARDLIVVEIAVEPTTGSPVLVAYGADRGTAVAAWYYANVVAKDSGLLSKSWVVCDWTDTGTVGPDAGDTWDCASG